MIVLWGMKLGTALIAFALMGPSTAFAAVLPSKKPVAAPAPNSVLPMGRSVGSPTTGRLVGGAHLGDAPYLRIVPAYANGDVRYGLGSLVGMLDRSARSVRRQFPDAVLSVGHLSRNGGGELDRHASHESGRDADVAFYVKDRSNKPVYADILVAFSGDGTARTWPGAVFDDARNWLLVAALLNDPVAHVSHIFVSAPLRARLLAYASKIGVAPSLHTRAALTMIQPHGSLPHDDHFHVRISCPPDMKGCIENPAYKLAHKSSKPAKKHSLWHPAPAPVAPKPAPKAAEDSVDEALPAVLGAPLDIVDGT